MPNLLQNSLTSLRESQFAAPFRRYPRLSVLLAYLTLFVMVFWSQVLQVNSHLLGAQLDGTKNAFALAAYVDGKSWLGFDAMNYPFGMGYLYTDGHVPLGMFCKALGLSGNAAVCLMFLLVLLSPALFCYYAFRLFKCAGVHTVLAVLAPLPIVLLSPQLERMLGHYALSYGFLFPALFYVVYFRLSARPSWLQLGLGTVLTFLVFLLHPYLGVLVCVAWMAKAVFPRSLSDDKRTKASLLSRIGLAAVPLVAVLLFQGMMVHTAPEFERPLPYGFWKYQSTSDSYLTPNTPTIESVFNGLFVLEDFEWEGRCYLGLMALVGLILLGIRLVFERKPNYYILLPFVLCAVVAYLLSTGYPFSEHPEYYAHAGPLQEFRTLGRFSWLCFYAVNFAVVIGLGVSRSEGSRWNTKYFQWGLMGLVAVGLYEGGGNLAHVKSKFPSEARFAEFDAAFVETPPFDSHQVEAIFPYPFVYVGCDNYGTPKNLELSKAMLKLSWLTGVPAVTNASSRQPVHYPAEMSSAYHNCGRLDDLLARFDSTKKDLAVLVQSEHLTQFATRTTPINATQIGPDFWVVRITKQDLLAGILESPDPDLPVLEAFPDLPVGKHRFETLVDLSAYPAGDYQFEFSYPVESSEPLVKAILYEHKSAAGVKWVTRKPITDATCWDGENVTLQLDFYNPSPEPGVERKVVLVNDTVYAKHMTLQNVVLRGRLDEATPHFPMNTLDYVGDIQQASDRGPLAFSDRGAWFAYGLSEGAAAGAGFSGPYLFTQDNGAWVSPSLSHLELTQPVSGEPLDWTGMRLSQSSYNSHLEQHFQGFGLAVSQHLVYATAHSALVTTRISNATNQEQRWTASWKGGTFLDGISFAQEDRGIRITSTRSEAVGHIALVDREFESLALTDTTYALNLGDLVLAPGEVIELALTHQFVFPEHSKEAALPEHCAGIEGANILLRQRTGEKQRELDGLYAKMDTVWQDKPYKDLVAKTVLTLQNNTRIAAGELSHAGLFPSYHYRWFHGFWAWDSWKHAAALVHYNPSLAKEQIRAMYAFQTEAGFIPDCVYRDTTIERHNYRNTKPPLSGWAIWEVYEQAPDKDFLKELFPKLLKQHLWWYTSRDHDRDGLCEYGCTDGTLIAAKWESGMDNGVRFDNSEILQNGEGAFSLNQESVDLNAYLYAEKLCLIQMMEVLGMQEEREVWQKQAEALKLKIQTQFFDGETGWFYDTSLDGTEFVSVMGCDGWLPLWAGAATVVQAGAVKDNMMDPAHFNTHVPFQTLSANHPDFEPNGGYWRGPNWLDQSYFGVKGLHNYGYHTEAYAATYKLFNNAEGVLQKGSALRENYHPITGQGLEAQNFSWTAGCYVLLLLGE